MTKWLIGLMLALVLGPSLLSAQTLLTDYQGSAKAKVLEVLSAGTEIVPGTSLPADIQTIRVEIISGPETGKIIELRNDFIQLAAGNRFFLDYLIKDGESIYTVGEPDRTWPLFGISLLFAMTVIFFGGFQGVRSLLALGFSFAVIFLILLPALLAGWPPILTSTTVAFIILTGAIFLTHGINRESTVALLGTTAAVILTGLLATWAVAITKLSGFASDEAVYLNIGTAGTLDFRGLLLGAIIIGILGVLDDIAITQASAVRELKELAGAVPPSQIYRRAIAIGREHVGALVNTLALAYAGAALPLLLLLSTSTLTGSVLLNKEVFAAEIVRTVVGSIGLVLAVPITTALAVWLPTGRLGPFGRPGRHSHHH